MSIISIRNEHDGKGTLTLWAPPCASTYLGVARPKRDGSGYRVTPLYGAGFDVRCPLRDDETWITTDALIGRRYDEIMARREIAGETVTTWADSFGRWHARVDLPGVGYGDYLGSQIDRIRAKARRAIRRELEARQAAPLAPVSVEVVRSRQDPTLLTTTSITFAEKG